MVKGVIIFGGIWAATATSVALVRRPQTEKSLEDGEVETLDPKEFTSKEGKEIFASRYLSYFASPKEVNKKFWERRFDEKRGDNDRIEVSDYSNGKLEIVSALDDPEKNSEGKISLVGFCREGYFTKSSMDGHNEWGTSSLTTNPFWDKAHVNLWSLCSVVGNKPEALFDVQGSFSLYSEIQIGRKAPYRLVKADTHNAFWDIREKEWQVLNVKDSKYFGEDKKQSHSIRELCKAAYSKNISDEDTFDEPSSTTTVKYCGLEWTWD